MKKLTPKQELFCQKVIELSSEAEAYRTAYNTKNMKPETVHSKACILRKDGKIAARISELQEEVKKRNDVTVDRLIQELKLISFFDPIDLYNEKGELKEIKDLPEEVRRAIAEVKVEEFIINKSVTKKKTTYKLYSKLDSIEKCAKHIGFYQKDNEQKGKSAMEAFLELMQVASK